MTKCIWEGNKVRLRPVKASDWEKFHNNDLDSEVARRCDVIHFPRSAEGTQEWAENQANSESEDHDNMLAIETLEGEVVGSINTHSCDSRHGTLQYGVGIFREYWRNGYGSDAVMIMLRYYFEELRYQKATAHIYSFNEGSIKLHEKLGFIKEGQLRRIFYTKGKYHDEVVYGITKEEFESLCEKKDFQII